MMTTKTVSKHASTILLLHDKPRTGKTCSFKCAQVHNKQSIILFLMSIQGSKSQEMMFDDASSTDMAIPIVFQVNFCILSAQLLISKLR